MYFSESKPILKYKIFALNHNSNDDDDNNDDDILI